MRSEFALEASDVQKKFGHFVALRGVSLRIPVGTCAALFGANGAGKTTLLKIAATLIRPTSGTFKVAGVDVREESSAARRAIGFLSHSTSVYRDLTPLENLHFFARMYDRGFDRIEPLIERVGLWRRRHDPVRTFSRGLQQRLGLARVLLHDPEVLLLDEPYTGLDAAAATMLDAVIDDCRAKGRTVVLTTHQLEQGVRAADAAVILDRGSVVYEGSARGSPVREAFDSWVRGTGKA